MNELREITTRIVCAKIARGDTVPFHPSDNTPAGLRHAVELARKLVEETEPPSDRLRHPGGYIHDRIALADAVAKVMVENRWTVQKDTDTDYPRAVTVTRFVKTVIDELVRRSALPPTATDRTVVEAAPNGRLLRHAADCPCAVCAVVP